MNGISRGIFVLVLTSLFSSQLFANPGKHTESAGCMMCHQAENAQDAKPEKKTTKHHTTD